MRGIAEIDHELCIRCGHCVSHCRTGALSLDTQVHLDPSLCSYCGDCEGVCPVGAIALPYEIVIKHKDEPGG